MPSHARIAPSPAALSGFNISRAAFVPSPPVLSALICATIHQFLRALRKFFSVFKICGICEICGSVPLVAAMPRWVCLPLKSFCHLGSHRLDQMRNTKTLRNFKNHVQVQVIRHFSAAQLAEQPPRLPPRPRQPLTPPMRHFVWFLLGISYPTNRTTIAPPLPFQHSEFSIHNSPDTLPSRAQQNRAQLPKRHTSARKSHFSRRASGGASEVASERTTLVSRLAFHVSRFVTLATSSTLPTSRENHTMCRPIFPSPKLSKFVFIACSLVAHLRRPRTGAQQNSAHLGKTHPSSSFTPLFRRTSWRTTWHASWRTTCPTTSIPLREFVTNHDPQCTNHERPVPIYDLRFTKRHRASSLSPYTPYLFTNLPTHLVLTRYPHLASAFRIQNSPPSCYNPRFAPVSLFCGVCNARNDHHRKDHGQA
jgi:hypothetical protein